MTTIVSWLRKQECGGIVGSKELPKHYDPKPVESKWQTRWLNNEIFNFNKETHNKPVYVIDTPPPFTSGNLHIGRAYACILGDVTARYKRMQGYNVLLPQGWDNQGLPTELAVQNKLGIPQEDIDQFREACKTWTKRMIRQMRNRMLRLGYMPDWTFEYRTMDKEYHRKVQLVLLKLNRLGRIYRSKHPIHWCPKCKTALADAELGYRKEETRLAHLRFKVGNELVEIATTRPELLHACVAVAFHPRDKRYHHLISTGETEIPIYNRKVPIIIDESVDPAYGTGVVMICTFGDEQDIKTVLKHKLPTIQALNDEGNLINSKYDGLSAREARNIILTDLGNTGALSKTTNITHNILAHMERSTCQTPIEFLSKPQWFIKITDLKKEITRVAEEIKWHPEHMKKRLIEWTENLEWDWLFSRQRRFGTPIPFWHCQKCNHIIPPKKNVDLPIDPTKEEPPINNCPSCGGKTIKPAEEVCDCWVDSSLTPLIITGWPKTLQNFPVNLRQQGSEIIRTWTFYSILQSHLQTGQQPFQEMLVNGMILGPDGRAMSSSLGNTIDPLEVVEEYGADSLRQTLLLASVGSDFPFLWKDTKYCYSFMQKFWSACRFAQKHITDYKPPKETPKLHIVDKGFLSLLQRLVSKITENMEKFYYSTALKKLQNFLWHEFCDYYIEIAKTRLYTPEEPWMKESSQYTLYMTTWNLTHLFSPFAPHLAEEIAEHLFQETMSKASWPSINENLVSEEAERTWAILKTAISTIRKSKTQLRLPLNAEIPEAIVSCDDEDSREILEILKPEIQEASKAKHVTILMR